MFFRFLDAWNFLTAVPLPFARKRQVGRAELGKSLPAFPLVGLILGGLSAGVYFGTTRGLPSPLAVLPVLLFMVLMTRGLHMDGLADTLDGLQGKNREEAFRIMKDSTIGAFGAAGLIFLLGFKAVSLAVLTASEAQAALLVTPLLGRTVFVTLMVFFPSARPGQGLADSFISSAGKKEWFFSLLIAVPAVFLIAKWKGLCVSVLIIGFSFLAGYFFRRRLGGVTGDIVGGTGEVCEAFALVLWNIQAGF